MVCYKTHFKLSSDAKSYCGIQTGQVSDDISEVSCLNCLKVLNAIIGNLLKTEKPLREFRKIYKPQPLFAE